ncbi:MAG: terminase family protein [Deltaproteobacteria bacterium]|nr:terminase family protein [Deltaproteobacteria bacterium]
MGQRYTPDRDFNGARTATGLLLPYQARWVSDMNHVKVCEKSRRIGLSWSEAADDVLWASQRGTGEKRNVWYIGYNKDMALEYINDCANWARAYNLAVSAMEETEDISVDEVVEDGQKVVKEEKILAFRITLESGWRITALSSRPANLRGKQGRIIIDEAAFHEDLRGLIKAAMAMLIWGGDVRIISTHNGDDNEFNSLVQDIRAKRKPYSLHRIDFDDALKDGLCKRIFQVLGREWTPEVEVQWRQDVIDSYGDDADEELFCVPSQGSGTFLSRALIETCLSSDIPVIRYERPASFAELADHVRYAEVEAWCEDILKQYLDALDTKRRHYFGEDFGRSGDLTDIIPLAEQQDTTFRAPFVLELRNIPFQQQEQILFYIVDRLPRFSYGSLDARGNGQYLAERAMQRYGSYRIAQVMLSESWYRENMPPYKAAFEDRSILLAKDADIIDDHRAFKFIKGVAKLPETKTRGQDRKQRHGDSGIAGALAWFSTRQDVAGPIEYETVAGRLEFAGRGAY